MKRVGDLAKSYLKKSKIKEREREGDVLRSWESIAGPELSQLTKVFDIDKKTLIIETLHPAAAQLLEFKKEIILSKVKRAYPELLIENLTIRRR